jgi:hypothetical protein
LPAALILDSRLRISDCRTPGHPRSSAVASFRRLAFLRLRSGQALAVHPERPLHRRRGDTSCRLCSSASIRGSLRPPLAVRSERPLHRRRGDTSCHLCSSVSIRGSLHPRLSASIGGCPVRHPAFQFPASAFVRLQSCGGLSAPACACACASYRSSISFSETAPFGSTTLRR